MTAGHPAKENSMIVEVSMSETFQQFRVMAQRNIFGQHDVPQLRKILTKLSFDALSAIDEGNIEFKNPDDKASLLALIMLSMDYGLEGKLKNAFEVCFGEALK
jgi:hypothetical protein